MAIPAIAAFPPALAMRLGFTLTGDADEPTEPPHPIEGGELARLPPQRHLQFFRPTTFLIDGLHQGIARISDLIIAELCNPQMVEGLQKPIVTADVG